MKVHHVGYAVTNIERAIKSAETLGYETGAIVEDDIRNVKIVFLKNGTEVIELIAPNGDNNPVEAIISKSGGPTPYHICYETENIEESIKELTATKRWILQKVPEIAPAINNCKVAFLYSNNLGMIELVEIK